MPATTAYVLTGYAVTTEESKEHSKEIVEQTDGKDPTHVAAGLKA